VDADGNPTPETVTTDRLYHYDDLHRLIAIDAPNDQGTPTEGLIQYSYDANGNPTAKTDNTGPEPVELHFAYDSRDQLTQVIRGPPDSGESLGRFDYNHAGLRIRHRDSARGDIDSLYDQHAVLEENTPQGAQIAHYRYGPKVHSLTSARHGTEYYQHDALGTTVALSDESAQDTARYRLDAWGEIEEEQGDSLNRQIYTGQEHDERTGLIYFGARFYDPDIGRFINQDSY
ncbi:MAG: RHS repeat domain-containing protein, partial [Gammaproteobacteria bacterium]